MWKVHKKVVDKKKLMHRPEQEDFENEKNKINHSRLKPIGKEK